MIGRMAPQKGFHTGIEIAKKSGCPLIIAGNIDKDEGDYFQTQIDPHIDGSQIKYVGPVDDEAKRELLLKARAFLMPIEWHEPFGIVMAEAMACGTPVVGFPLGAVPEVVNQGTTGFICNDITEAASAIQHIGAIERAACRQHVEENFSKSVVTERYISAYTDVLP